MCCWNMWADIFCRFQEMSILKFSQVAMPWLQAAGLFGVGPLSVNGNMGIWFKPPQRKLVKAHQGKLLFLG